MLVLPLFAQLSDFGHCCTCRVVSHHCFLPLGSSDSSAVNASGDLLFESLVPPASQICDASTSGKTTGLATNPLKQASMSTSFDYKKSSHTYSSTQHSIVLDADTRPSLQRWSQSQKVKLPSEVAAQNNILSKTARHVRKGSAILGLPLSAQLSDLEHHCIYQVW